MKHSLLKVYNSQGVLGKIMNCILEGGIKQVYQQDPQFSLGTIQKQERRKKGRRHPNIIFTSSKKTLLSHRKILEEIFYLEHGYFVFNIREQILKNWVSSGLQLQTCSGQLRVQS